MRGKFIVIYGPNNLGKSTQVKRLYDHLKSKLPSIKSIKYPLYDFEPTGPLINRILRPQTSEDRKYTDEEFQELTAQNRKDYQPILIDLLNSGATVLSEDYTGTGLAWGLTKGVSRNKLDEFNLGLIQPDLAIMLDGKERYIGGIEEGHRHESADDQIWLENRLIHRQLAKEFGWVLVNANQTPDEVEMDIRKIVTDFLAGHKLSQHVR